MEHSELQTKYNNKLLFKLSQIGFGLNADLLFTNRIIENKNDVQAVRNLKYGDKICIYMGESPLNFNELISILNEKNMKINFYICAEPLVHIDIIQLLLPYAIHMYVQNNIYDNPKIHIMPIGIRDCGNVVPAHREYLNQSLYNEMQKIVYKNILCLLCYSYTHDERHRCDNALKDKNWIMNLNDSDYGERISAGAPKIALNMNYEYTHKSLYVLCPRGAGEDTHRFYEAIYLDAIPIVKRTNTVFDKLYVKFPCLVVEDWSDITEQLLYSNLENCQAKLRNFKNKYPYAFTDINSIAELLLEL